jgi:hypothetical protein
MENVRGRDGSTQRSPQPFSRHWRNLDLKKHWSSKIEPLAPGLQGCKREPWNVEIRVEGKRKEAHRSAALPRHPWCKISAFNGAAHSRPFDAVIESKRDRPLPTDSLSVHGIGNDQRIDILYSEA